MSVVNGFFGFACMFKNDFFFFFLLGMFKNDKGAGKQKT
jgi:hypothetical protein